MLVLEICNYLGDKSVYIYILNFGYVEKIVLKRMVLLDFEVIFKI